MKNAETLDIWRRLQSRKKHRTLPLKVSIGNHPLFLPGQEFTISPGITGVCGANGTGKSRLIRILDRLLSEDNIDDGMDVSASAKNQDSEDCLPSKCEPGDSVVVEPEKLRKLSLDHIPQSIGDYPLTPDELDPYGIKSLDEDFMSTASYVLGKNYTEIEIHDLCDDQEDIDSLPYIKVTDGGRTYYAPDMGDGELSCLLLMWTLSISTPRSVFFIEEPETFLSPMSQIRILDYIARIALKKNLGIVLTTHSPDLLTRIDIASILLLQSGPNGTSISKAVSHSQLRECVGLRIPRKGVFAVEDRRAAELLRAILSKHQKFWLQEFRIKPLNGTSAVVKIYDLQSLNDSEFQILGVLDGDQRNDPDKEKLAVEGTNLFFLPTSQDPDEIAFDVLTNHPENLSNTLGISKLELEQQVYAATALDKHDRILSIANHFGIEPSVLSATIFSYWANDDDNKVEIDSFLTQIDSQIQL